MEKLSKGAASTAWIVSWLLGWKVASPLDTSISGYVREKGKSAKQEPTKVFLVAFGLHNFYDTRTKSFNEGNMVWNDTHVSRLGRNVHLNHILRTEDSSLEFDKFYGRIGLQVVKPCSEALTKVLAYRLSRRIHIAPVRSTMHVVQQRTTPWPREKTLKAIIKQHLLRSQDLLITLVCLNCFLVQVELFPFY